MIITVLAFIFVFGVLVLVHEFGHFITAKYFGVWVKEFAFGFKPKIWSIKKGDTIYAINALPIGGYVSLYGEAGEASKNKKSLTSKKPWQRAVVFVAGVTLNLLLGWLLITIFYIVGGRPIIDGMQNYRGVTDARTVTITEVAKNSPAEKSGLKPGVTIYEINDKKMTMMTDVSSEVKKTSEVNGSKAVKFLVGNKDQKEVKTINTYKEEIEVAGKKITVDRVGITMNEGGKIQAKWYLAPWIAAKESFRIIKLNVVGIGNFIAKLFVGKMSQDVGGAIAIAQISGNAARMGVMPLLQFIAVLSLTLAFFNILPFPALDGGHIAIIGIEKIAGRKIPDKIKNSVNWVGFGLLLVLMALATINDLTRIGLFEYLKGLM